VSSHSYWDDEEMWKGIMTFTEQGEGLAIEYRKFRNLSPDERQAESDRRAKLFEERFNAKTVFQNAKIDVLLGLKIV